MGTKVRLDPTVLVIFGAAGDLAWRKLVPAIYNLSLDGYLPDQFAILGLDKKKLDDDAFRDRLRDGVEQFSRRGAPEPDRWEAFESKLAYLPANFAEPESFREVRDRIEELTEGWKEGSANWIHYLAVPPALIEAIVGNLSGEGLAGDPERTRVVVEKPFGHDLESARALNRTLSEHFRECQIYRIDHYLGKETVQNILALRFANAVFEPLWDQRYIDHVQITMSESVGVGHRAEYYEGAGALRDMIQNHLLQVLCLVAMEPPVSFDDNEIRNKKVDVLRAIRPIPGEDVHDYAVRGQYGPGWIEGEKVVGYREEEAVNPESDTETFAALKLFVDNWRWQGVPFYLRTGKRLLAKASEVCIHFRRAPHRSFPRSAVGDWPANTLIIRIQPDEGVLLGFQAKRPGPRMRLGAVDMHFRYGETFEESPPEAYETLILDVMMGDATLFKRTDQVEAAWSVVTPVLEAWDAGPPSDFPNYRAGSWGPAASERLIAQDGRSWAVPTAAPEEAGGVG